MASFAAVREAAAAVAETGESFIAADKFEGAREGYAFKAGDRGSGYYKLAAAAEVPAGDDSSVPTKAVKCLDGVVPVTQADMEFLLGSNLPCSGLPMATVQQVLAAAAASRAAGGSNVEVQQGAASGKENAQEKKNAMQAKKKKKKKSEPMSFPEVGERVVDAKERKYFATVRYVGTVHTSKNKYANWVGVEWDDHTRGKHDGWLDGDGGGRSYFKCPKGAGSFVKPSKLIRARPFLEVMKERYEHGGKDEEQINAVDTIRGKTKPILLIGMDKVADWHQLSAIEKVSLQDLDVGNVASSPDLLREACPKVKELNLRKTLFGNWADIAKLGRGLPKLRNLMLSENRFDKLPHPLPETHTLRGALDKLQVLVLSNTCSNFGTLLSLDSALPMLRELHFCGNDMADFDPPMTTYGAWAQTTGDRTDDKRGKVGGPVTGFQQLRVLNLSQNKFSDWRQIFRLAWLPSLEKIMLNENQLSVIEAVSESEILEKQAAPAYSVVYDGDVVGGGAAAEEEKSPVEGKAEISGPTPSNASMGSFKNKDMRKWVNATGVTVTAGDDNDDGNVGAAGVPFASLKSISLDRNDISSWSSLDVINTFPAIEALRFQHNPLTSKGSGSVIRQTVIARIKGLRSFNGSEVRPLERQDAEKLYIKRALVQYRGSDESKSSATLASALNDLEAEHPRVRELLEAHGEPAVGAAGAVANGAASAGRMGNLVRVTIVSNDPRSCTVDPISKKLPDSMSIGAVKLIAKRRFKLSADRMALYYRDNNTMGHPEKLDDDDMCLADYGVQDGGEILMEDAGQRASEDNDAAASSSSAGAETMEAIRKAREAEVRAVANAAADAASAVPYVSTIR